MIHNSLLPAALLGASPVPLNSQVLTASINCLLNCESTAGQHTATTCKNCKSAGTYTIVRKTLVFSYCLLAIDTDTIYLWHITYVDLRKNSIC